ATITTNPGSGIQFPGWHFFAPAPPPTPPPPPPPPNSCPVPGSDYVFVEITPPTGPALRLYTNEEFTVFLPAASDNTVAFYDPTNNTIASEVFHPSSDGTPGIIPFPTLLPDTGAPQADGLSAAAAAIVGVNPDQASNLIPGMTDLAVLQ